MSSCSKHILGGPHIALYGQFGYQVNLIHSTVLEGKGPSYLSWKVHAFWFIDLILKMVENTQSSMQAIPDPCILV